MIQSGRASLVVTSVETDPDAVSALLTLDPSKVDRTGTALRSGRIRAHHVWSLNVGSLDNTDDDQTGTRALRELLELSRSPCAPTEEHTAAHSAMSPRHVHARDGIQATST